MLNERQARLLGRLFCYDQITLRRGGYYLESGDRVDLRTLRGLIKRNLLQFSAWNIMPSIGDTGSPIFDERGVTKKGIKALQEYVDSVSLYGKPVWVRRIEKILVDGEE